MRFGLVGTGYWARVTHAPALAAAEEIEFTAVWGRNPDAAAELAGDFGAQPHRDLATFLAGVDGVAFAVPPGVQAPIATRAAAEGKHLLLEKPIASSDAEADLLTAAVERAGVSSVVFFTHRFRPDIRDWLAEVTGRDGWLGGVCTWFGSSLLADSPFNTPWRRDMGGLWDIAPHVISLLWTALGPVTSVTADAGPADVAHLVLHHRGGASSTVTVTQAGGETAAGLEAYLWNGSGRSHVPVKAGDSTAALRTALGELVANARAGRTEHPCDVRFGRDVGRVIAEAQRQIEQRQIEARTRGGSAPDGAPGELRLHNE
jgi:predicted dehydrogenase